jgi:type I restriction enzyme, S subunit
MDSEALRGPSLPPGWAWRRMGDIADVVGGGTPRTSDPTNFVGGEIPWITPADLSGHTAKRVTHGARNLTSKGLSSCGARLLPAGSVLFTSRAPIGYVAIAGCPIATNQGFKSFVLREDVLPEYVYWWLKGAKKLAEGLASGTTFLEISGASAKKLPIPLAPREQQRQVVSEIEKQFSRLDEAVANLQRAKANLKRYKASVLKAAVEGRLVETEVSIARRDGRSYETGEQLLLRVLTARRLDWHKKAGYREPCSHSASNVNALPEGWAWATVEQLNPGNRPCAYGVLQPGDDLPGGIPFVRVGDIVDGRIECAQMKRIHNDVAAAYPRTKLMGGEVLLTLVGAIGRTAVVPASLAGGNVARAVGVLPISELVDPHWVEIWFRNPAKIVEMTGKSHEVARKTLNLEDVRLSAVALPPLNEQRRIVAEVDRRLSIVRELEAEVDANLKRAQALRKSVLGKAFGS